MSDLHEKQCICCGSPAEVSVELTAGNDRNENERYGLPDQYSRSGVPGHPPISTTPFCSECKTKMSDAVRATIRNLQYDHGRAQQRFRDQRS